MNIKEKIQAKFRKNEEEPKMKLNWSLRKKLIVGAGVLGTAALGIIAYGKSKQETEVEYSENDQDEEYDDDDESEDDDQDAGEETEVDKEV